MEQVCTLRLIRHAHVDTGPPPGRLCGWLDLPLSPRGQEQVRRWCDRQGLDGAPDALYSSPLRRAVDVAVALGKVWGRRVCPDGALREIDCGRLDGIAIEEAERRYPDLLRRNRAQQDDEFTWPEGESYRGFRERVLGGLARIAAAHPGGRVAVVTHAGVIAQVLGAIRGRPPAVWELDRPDFFTATDVVWRDGRAACVLAFSQRDWR